MENKLNDTLNFAAKAAPIISSKQVLQNVIHAPKKHYFGKVFLLLGILGAIGAALMFTCRSYFYIAPTAATKMAANNTKQPILQNNFVESPVSVKQSAQSNNEQKSSINKPILAKAKHQLNTTATNQQNVPMFGYTNQTANLYASNFENENEPLEELTLNYAELAELGIVTDGNTLTYFAITDSFKMIKEGNITKRGAEMYDINIDQIGGSSSNNGYCYDSVEALKGKPFYAAFLELISKDRNTFTTINNFYGSSFYEPYFDSIKPYLIPIDVYLKAEKTPLSHDKTVRFWFKNTPIFLNALPPHIAQSVKVAYPNIKDEAYFKGVINHFRKINEDLYIYSYTPDFVKLLQNNYIQINQGGFKALGFKISPKKILLKSVSIDYREKQGKKSISKTSFVNKGQTIYINQHKKLFITLKRANQKTLIAPIAYSDAKISSISILRTYRPKLSLFTPYTNDTEFKKVAPNLIPILIDSQHVFWFERNAEVSSIVEQFKK